jgi:hypothetical protein
MVRVGASQLHPRPPVRWPPRPYTLMGAEFPPPPQTLPTEVTPECIRYRNGLAYRRTPPGGPSVPVWQVAAEQDGPTARGQVTRRAQG